MGQFMTPEPLANRVVERLCLSARSRVLEPSFGDGAFLIPLIRRLLSLHEGTHSERLEKVLAKNVFGVEIDRELRDRALTRIAQEFGPLPRQHNLAHGDFFSTEYLQGFFDCIVGNPPYGGTFDPALEDRLDRMYGYWDGHKLKKETYSFFIARSLEWLAPEGTLTFITSDSFLTINTMSGLRRKLLDLCEVTIESLPDFSDEVNQATLVLHAKRSGPSDAVSIDGESLTRDAIALTDNFSWGLDPSMAVYFRGPTLGDFVIASSGMTIGKNELFVREIVDGQVEEPYHFEFFDEPITLERELYKARLNKLSPRMVERIRIQEREGATVRNVRITPRSRPFPKVRLPHPDYRYYNKADGGGVVYLPPRWAVYWRNEGEALLTFKKNGRWYLHGVGGRPYFGREGLTWSLVSSRINMRYLPAGYLFDSGAPCAFLRPGVSREELWFILGWCLTLEATTLLKTAINHTRNIQSKDMERMPYPWWVDAANRRAAVSLVEGMVKEALSGRAFARNSNEIGKLEALYALRQDCRGSDARGDLAPISCPD